MEWKQTSLSQGAHIYFKISFLLSWLLRYCTKPSTRVKNTHIYTQFSCNLNLGLPFAMTDPLTRPEVSEIKRTVPRTPVSSSNTSLRSVMDATPQGHLIDDTQQSSVDLPPHSPPPLGTELHLFSLLLLASLCLCLPSHLSLSQPGVSCVSLTFFQEASPLTSRTLRDLIINQSHADLHFLPVSCLHLISHK